jgi:hypothetical protein
VNLPSKEEIIAAITACAARLGRAPLYHELRAELNLNHRQLRRTFGTYGRALEACGLRPSAGVKASTDALFRQWAGAARKLGRIPNTTDFELEGYSSRTLRGRFSGWANVAPAMKRYAMEAGLAEEWADVVEMVSASEQMERASAGVRETAPGGGKDKEDAEENWTVPGAPVYGAPINSPVLLHAPTNEMGVLILFASLAVELGYRVRHVRSAFPDCDALRRIDDDHWQPVKIEFELLSRNFVEHGHDPLGCDLIVCWKHNWPECPLRVLELCKVVEKG